MPMKEDLVASAARNNALWCDAVCQANGEPGEFRETLWLNRHGTPRFYPDAVTLSGGAGDSEIVDAIADLVASHPGRAWAVKDSFRRLDLRGLDFEPLFDAHWLHLATPHEDRLRGSVTVLKTATELAAWEKAWAGSDDPAEASPFKQALLSNPEIVFASVICDGVMEGGGILNRGGGVVGVSNVFARPPFIDTVWRQLISLSARIFPDFPLVGYEHGSGFEASCRNGFEPIGLLRIWVREISSE